MPQRASVMIASRRFAFRRQSVISTNGRPTRGRRPVERSERDQTSRDDDSAVFQDHLGRSEQGQERVAGSSSTSTSSRSRRFPPNAAREKAAPQRSRRRSSHGREECITYAARTTLARCRRGAVDGAASGRNTDVACSQLEIAGSTHDGHTPPRSGRATPRRRAHLGPSRTART